MHNVPPGSETHFKVLIVSSSFAGLPSLARHRLVNAAASSMMLCSKAATAATTTATVAVACVSSVSEQGKEERREDREEEAGRGAETEASSLGSSGTSPSPSPSPSSSQRLAARTIHALSVVAKDLEQYENIGGEEGLMKAFGLEYSPKCRGGGGK